MSDVNQKLLNALGLGNERHLVSVDLRMRVSEPPILTLGRLVVDGKEFIEQTFEYEVKEPKPEPFDLDRLCRSAMARLFRQIESDCEWNRAKVKFDGRQRAQEAGLE